MTFVVTDDNHDRMNDFAKMMLAVFPGSILYLYTKPMEMINCLLDHQVDAVFAEAVMKETDGAQFLIALRERNSDMPVFVTADSDEYKDDVVWNDIAGYLIRPVSEDDLRNAVHSVLEQCDEND